MQAPINWENTREICGPKYQEKNVIGASITTVEACHLP